MLSTLAHTQQLPGSSDANTDSSYCALNVYYGESAPLTSSTSARKP